MILEWNFRGSFTWLDWVLKSKTGIGADETAVRFCKKKIHLLLEFFLGNFNQFLMGILIF